MQKSTDGGDSWTDITPGNDIVSISIDMWLPQTVYAGSNAQDAHIYKTINGGTTWNTYDLPATGDCGIFDICSNSPANKVYARITGSSVQTGLYKSRDGGMTWTSCGFSGQDVSALAMDYAEPEILYAALNEVPPSGRTFLAVDGGAAWIEVANQLPNDATDLGLDINYPASVYAATENGIYSLTPTWQFKSLTSSSSQASFVNNGRKLVRKENTLWACYESGGVIYVTKSTDLGTRWEKKIELGQGIEPAINIPPVVMPPCPLVGVVWVTNTYPDTLYLAELWPDGWTKTVLYVSEEFNFATPSIVYSSIERSHIMVREYEDFNPTNTLIRHFWHEGGNVYQEQVPNGQGGSFPSSGWESASNTINVVWEESDGVYYAYKNLGTGLWTYRGKISSTLLRCHHPSMDVAGQYAYIAFETGPIGGTLDIRYVKANPGTGSVSRVYWLPPTADDSQYPEMVGGNYAVWQENVAGSNWETYFTRYDPVTGQWSTPENISSTSKRSAYPHLAYRTTVTGTNIYFIWTENDLAPYNIDFATRFFASGTAEFILDAGTEEDTPFTVYREGTRSYGEEPYKNHDMANDTLLYRFNHLNPEQGYKIGVVFYYREGNTKIKLKVDDYSTNDFNVKDSLIVAICEVPVRLVADSALSIKLKKLQGAEAHVGLILLYPYEYEKNDGGSGPQDVFILPFNSYQLVLDVYPNPAQKSFDIVYCLPRKAKIKLSIYDASGRLVKELINTEQDAGSYKKNYEMTLPSQGVYFVRLHADNYDAVEKVVFLK